MSRLKTIHQTLIGNGATLSEDLYFTQIWDAYATIFTVNGVYISGLNDDDEFPAYCEYPHVAFGFNPAGYFPLVYLWNDYSYWVDTMMTFIREDEIVAGGIVIPADPNAPIKIATIGRLEEFIAHRWETSFRWGDTSYNVYYYELPLTPASATIKDVQDWVQSPDLAHLPYTTSPIRSAEFGVDLNPVEYSERIQKLEALGYDEKEIARFVFSYLYSLSSRFLLEVRRVFEN